MIIHSNSILFFIDSAIWCQPANKTFKFRAEICNEYLTGAAIKLT